MELEFCPESCEAISGVTRELEAGEEGLGILERKVAFPVLIVKQPKREATQFVTKQGVSEGLFVRSCYLVLVYRDQVFVGKQSVLHVAEVALVRVDQLRQIFRVNGNIELVDFRHFAMHLNQAVS